MIIHGPPKERRASLSAWLLVAAGLAAAVFSALLVGGARSANDSSGLIAFVRRDGIYVVHPDGGGVRALRRGKVASAAYGLAWSPDGRRLAFAAYVRRTPGIWVMDANGSDLVRLVTGSDASLVNFGPLTWSPRGRKIAFAADRALGGEKYERDIWVVNADGSRLHRLAKMPHLWEYDVAWSPTANRIAFTSAPWRLQLCVMNTDGSSLRIFKLGSAFEAATPSWSPDGRRIAFTRWPSDSWRSAEIWIADPDGRSRVRLTRDEVRDSYPTWSPDGSRIAFVRRGGEYPLGTYPDKSAELYMVNANGELTRLTHNRLIEAFPAWQPVAVR